MTEQRTVVVGAGVIGLSVAYYLSRSGEDVVVLDPSRPGGGCSSANAGWVVPQTTAPLPEPGIVRYALASLRSPASPFYLKPRLDPALLVWLVKFWAASNRRAFDAGRRALVHLGRDTIDLFDELRDESEFVTNSEESLLVFPTLSAAQQAAEAQRRAAADLGLSFVPEVLSGTDARALEPVLSDKAGGALLHSHELQVDSASVCDALVAAIVARGGSILSGQPVEGFETSGRRIQAAVTAEERFGGSSFVVAAGSATPDIVRGLGTRLPMQAGKGYSFTVSLPHVPTRMVGLAASKICIVPNAGATRVVGTMELSGPNARIDGGRIKAMIAGTSPYVDSWPAEVRDADDVSDAWVGLRPMTADGLPVIDRLGTYDNGYVSTGHAMMGLSLGLSSGRALASFILERKRPGDLEPFALNRRPTLPRFRRDATSKENR